MAIHYINTSWKCIGFKMFLDALRNHFTSRESTLIIYMIIFLFSKIIIICSWLIISRWVDSVWDKFIEIKAHFQMQSQITVWPRHGGSSFIYQLHHYIHWNSQGGRHRAIPLSLAVKANLHGTSGWHVGWHANWKVPGVWQLELSGYWHSPFTRRQILV